MRCIGKSDIMNQEEQRMKSLTQRRLKTKLHSDLKLLFMFNKY